MKKVTLAASVWFAASVGGCFFNPRIVTPDPSSSTVSTMYMISAIPQSDGVRISLRFEGGLPASVGSDSKSVSTKDEFATEAGIPPKKFPVVKRGWVSSQEYELITNFGATSPPFDIRADSGVRLDPEKARAGQNIQIRNASLGGRIFVLVPNKINFEPHTSSPFWRLLL